MSKADAPTLSADRLRDGTLRVWCKYCGKFHYHGGCVGTCTERRRRLGVNVFQGEPCDCPPGTSNGHRTAHCGKPDSPYRKTGYYVKEAL
jgi:hypothetical protein